MSSRKELRVVLLGKTGSGKSSLGNTLIGREAFRVASGMSSETERCQFADTELSDIVLQVTDTPGLCDTDRDEDDVLKEVAKSVAVASPGPHIILIVMRSDRRFTEEEYQAYQTLKKLFGKDIRRHMMIAFTAIDGRGSTLEQQRSAFEKELGKCPARLKEVIGEAQSYFGVNNVASAEERRQQAEDILQMMRALDEKNGGVYYDSDLSQNVNKLVEPLVQDEMSKKRVSRRAAAKEVKRAIVEEKSYLKSFFGRLVETVGDAVLSALGAVLQIAAKAVVKKAASKCIVM